MTSLCTEYYQIFLAQGVGAGIGVGTLFLPVLSVIPRERCFSPTSSPFGTDQPPEWFQRRRALATGIVVSGSSVGGVCFPSQSASFTVFE
jgi:MFS family permease